jgi:hypothetical protein
MSQHHRDSVGVIGQHSIPPAPGMGNHFLKPSIFMAVAMVLLFGMLMIQQKRHGRRTFDITPKELLLGVGLGLLFLVCSALLMPGVR